MDDNLKYLLIGGGIGGLLGFILAWFIKRGELDTEKKGNEGQGKEIGRLTSELQTEKTAKDELTGENKIQYTENANLKAENATLLKQVSDFKASENSKKREQEEGLQRLKVATDTFDDEKKRVRREDEDRLVSEKEEIHRMWAEHEENVKIKLTDLCKSSQYGFQYYDNNNLPINFGGRFKPDFLVEFLSQYVIFDAKVSESDLQNYINSAVKTTVEKIGNDPQIYTSVFLVVPSIVMQSLKKIRFYEQGYEFFVITPEAIEIVLASFKKISSYELAQQLDPRDREKIVNIIAEFDNHINMRNALDILASESGISVLEKANTLVSDIKDDILLKKSKMRLPQFTPTEIKTLMLSSDIQKGRIEDAISPKAAILETNVNKVRSVLKKNK